MKQTQTKKDRILEAAFLVYSESGFINVRMEDIAKRAGVGKGTMYQYFSSKENLLEETIQSCILSYITTLESLFESKESLAQILKQWVAFHRLAMSQSDGMMELMNSKGFTMSKELKETLYSHRQRLFLLIDNKIKDHIAKGLLPEKTDSAFVLALLFGTITHYYCPASRLGSWQQMDTDQFVQHMEKLLLIDMAD